MNIRKSGIIVAGLILVSVAVNLWFYPQMPEKIASHWNAQGQVDGYMSKTVWFFLIPSILAGIALMFFLVIPVIDPLKQNIKKFRKYYDGFIIVFCVFMLAIQLHVVLWSIGVEVSPNRVVPVGLGLLFFYCGILCENVKRNWFIGIRTPWTLSNDIVWERTHKVGSKLFKVAGVIVCAGVFFPNYMLYFILVPVGLLTVYTVVYSYVEFRKVKKGDTADDAQTRSGNKTWDGLKEGYLGQVEKVLSSVQSSRKKEVLSDVCSHLDRRFAELGPEEQTWENFQAIITEMGPASDYAELLEPNGGRPRQRVREKNILWGGIIVVIAVVGIILIPRMKKEVKASVPLVVSTVPAAFDSSVSPELKEITVTFDQPMMNLSWSWVGTGETFPEKTSEPRYDKSKATCTLPVKLEVGRFYWVGINSPQFKHFQTDMGVAAQPYVILFATKDKEGKATAIPDNYIEEAKEINSRHGKQATTKPTP